MSLFQELDLSQIKGRVLVVADVHGHFEKLEAALKALNYKPANDRLVFLGDLIDRGPHSHLVDEYLGHARILGNHEQMMWCGVREGADPGAWYTFVRNGGGWVEDLPADEVRTLAGKLIDAPVALEIRTPAGNRIGCVHAEIPVPEWRIVRQVLSFMSRDKLEEMLRRYDELAAHERLLFLHGCLWSRDAIDREPVRHCQGIDHTFHGHTPVRAIRTRGNATWLDGHAYAGGPMNIIDVDNHLWLLRNRADTEQTIITK
jgi:serine/threonine protein phosphatase 1